MKYFSILLLFMVFAISCEKEQTQTEKDNDIIINYLAEHNLEAISHTSGLYFQITEEGTGGHPSAYSSVEVKYKGYLTNGDVFDETTGSKTVTFKLSGLITGWQIGIPLLKSGGKGTFYIPSSLGYGERKVGSIPPNSVLIFEIELISFY
jgi:FKBP-type peptidyl-prolyl cis-trans isomerase FkpA